MKSWSGSATFICVTRLRHSKSPSKSSKMMNPPFNRYARRFVASAASVVQPPGSDM
ncbi:hypothetical protein D3C83_141050 [compost metagenome]